MENEQKKDLSLILISALLFAAALLLRKQNGFQILYFLPAYLVSGFSIIKEAFEKITHGELLDEDFLMTAASIGALILGEYPEAVAVMILYRVGELFEDAAVERSRQNIAAVSGLRPEFARIYENGAYNEVSPEVIEPGTIIEVRPGERVPVDGTIFSGEGSLDVSSLTGESIPLYVSVGDKVLSGSIASDSVLKIKTLKRYEESEAARILKLVQEAEESKSKSESFITRFARIYTPIVCSLGILIMILPSLFTGDWPTWIYRGLLFLVASCPCALVISVPLAYFAGIGGAARNGILVKGGTEFDKLSKVKTAAFDKTGTLTTGNLSVSNYQNIEDITKEEFLSYAASAESASAHPIAKAVVKVYPSHITPQNVKEYAGRGVSAMVGDNTVLCGSEKFLKEHSVLLPDQLPIEGTTVHIACNKKYIGSLSISDTLKPDASKSIAQLKKLGIHKTILVSGDSLSAVTHISNVLNMDGYYANLLPEDKAEVIDKLKTNGESVLYVGDGINDSPVLALADTGIAMGALGSDAAIEASGIVIMDDNLMKIPLSIAFAKKTAAISKQNIVFALSLKVLVLLFGAFGLAGMWAAVFADVGVCIITVLNALRCLKKPTIKD